MSIVGDAILLGGGGIAEAYAVISVTYPAGSVCTCTKGTQTLRAKDTSGEYFFLIPEAGTWTVSCTDGSKTKSQNVVIERQYQGENIKLFYDYTLYDHGTFRDGFQFKYKGEPEVRNVDFLHLGAYTYVGIYWFSPSIDLSEYSLLSIDFQSIESTQTYRDSLLAITSDVNFASEYIESLYAKAVVSVNPPKFGTTMNTASVDISNVNSGYVAMSFSLCEAKVFKIYLS